MDCRSGDELTLCERPEEWLDKLINRDGGFKDLASRLDFESSVSGKISLSGLREVDYPPLQFHAGGELEVSHCFALPPDLVERFSGIQTNCLMGILSPCERAYVTIDNELFMWNYEDGEDLAYYDGIKDTIICVGLVTPKAGLLPNPIRHLLCIATPLEIFILGMTYLGDRNGNQSSSLIPQVMPDPLYCLPTDNLTVTCVETTINGRIFFGTQEGSLLELDYGPIPGWNGDCIHPLPNNGRTGPCSLVNHSSSALNILLPTLLTSGFRSIDPIHQLVCDPVRHLLYARTEDSNLTVYDYSGKPSAVSTRGPFSRLAHLSGSDLAYSASNVVRSVDKSQFRSIVSIIPLSTGFCHLMAVTRTGIRLYFGERLRLLHIRLPPASHYGRSGLGEVKLVAETRGTVVLISSPPPDISPDSFTRTGLSTMSALQPFGKGLPASTGSSSGGPADFFAQRDDETLPGYGAKPYVMHTLSPDPYPWTPNLTEVCHSAWCVTGAWALTVLPWRDRQPDVADDLSSRHVSASDKASELLGQLRGEPPVVLTQHLDPPYRRLLLISAQGLVHLRLPSPLIRLKNYLLREISSNSLNAQITVDGLLDHPYLISPIRPFTRANLMTSQMDASTNESSGHGALFLSSFLHQFSPDEAICAALVIGASQSDWDDVNSSSVNLCVEQAILTFAAQAAQFWIPAVKRPNLDTNVNHRLPLSSQCVTPALSHPHPMDKTLSSGLFLFTGLFVFLARVGRTFWRSPLFRDASALFSGPRSPGVHESRGLRSWMYTFVNVLASASPLRISRTAMETKHPIISRLDSNEIMWIIQQINFSQKFLRRQLDIRGGWLRATTSSPSKFAAFGDTPTGGDRSGHAEMMLLQRLAEELDKLLSNILEILSFWRVLSEHAVHKVVERMTDEQRNLLLQVPFETYALGLSDSSYLPERSDARRDLNSPISSKIPFGAANRGMELVSALINALIDYYLIESKQDLDSGINLDAITTRLQAACPTLFANEDALAAKASECLIQANLLRSTLLSEYNPNSTVPMSEPVVHDLFSQLNKFVSQALELYREAGPTLDLDGAVQRLESVGCWRGAIALCLIVASKRDPNNIAVECLKSGRRPSSEPMHPVGKADRSNRRLAFAHSELAATEGRYDAYHQLVRCIERLWELANLPAGANVISPTSTSSQLGVTVALDLVTQPSSLNDQLVELNLTPLTARSLLMTVLRDVIQSDDILAHFEALGWLLSHRLTDTVISLNSPHLESYLRSRLRQTPDDPDLRSLLWRQLERRGARFEAAQVLEHLAVTPCHQLTLDARLDFLSRAIVSVKALPTGQQNLDYLHDLESRLELAQLQQQLHNELSQLSFSSSPTSRRTRSPRGTTDGELSDALYRLTHGPLLSLSDMFTDYADKFGLHESKLALLFAGDSDDAVLITAIWRDLLRHVLYSGTKDTSFSSVSSPSHGLAPDRGRQSAESSRRLVEIALVDCLSRLWARFTSDNRVPPSKSQLFFPLFDIISTLEYHAIRQKLPNDWVPTVLRDARLTCSSGILDAYDTLLHSKDKLWRHPDVHSRLFVAFVTVIEDFLSTVSVQLPTRQRMLQIGRISDCVISNLVDLDANPINADEGTPKGEHAPNVTTRLRQMYDQLQRFYR